MVRVMAFVLIALFGLTAVETKQQLDLTAAGIQCEKDDRADLHFRGFFAFQVADSAFSGFFGTERDPGQIRADCGRCVKGLQSHVPEFEEGDVFIVNKLTRDEAVAAFEKFFDHVESDCNAPCSSEEINIITSTKPLVLHVANMLPSGTCGACLKGIDVPELANGPKQLTHEVALAGVEKMFGLAQNQCAEQCSSEEISNAKNVTMVQVDQLPSGACRTCVEELDVPELAKGPAAVESEVEKLTGLVQSKCPQCSSRAIKGELLFQANRLKSGRPNGPVTLDGSPSLSSSPSPSPSTSPHSAATRGAMRAAIAAMAIGVMM